MGNLSKERTHVVNARCAGLNSNVPGQFLGGTYYPAVKNPDGSISCSAKFVCRAFVNRKGRYDDNGKKIEGRNEVMPLTFWNTRSSEDGKGLADIAAKCISAGKEFSFEAEAHSYEGKVYDNGQIVMKADGTGPLLTLKHGWTVEPGTLVFGDDADKVIAAETQSYTGAMDFKSRPMDWDSKDPNHPHRLAWKQTSNLRMGTQYMGGPTYGYAAVAGAPAAIQTPQVPASQPAITPEAIAAAMAMLQGMGVSQATAPATAPATAAAGTVF